ncbi:partial Response regulator PleD, partial [Anaerolineales bacterium]
LQEIQNIAVQGYAPDGTIQYWNSASERFYGYSAQEALGRNLLDLIIPPEIRDEVRRDVQKMVETGHPIPASELSLMRKDGSRISVYSSHTIVSCPGCVPELFCLDVDLTERKRTEELLRESEWRNRIVSELTTDYIFVVDVGSNGILKFRWASDNLFRITGRTMEEVTTSDLWGDIIHPDDRERFFGFITQILSTAEAGELECRTFYKHGGERWICIFAHPQIGSEDGVTTIVGAIQDITKRKRVEEKLAYQANLLANVNDAIIASDAEYRLTAWNSAAETLYGWKAEEVLGRNGLEIIQTQWSQEDAESMRRTIAETGRWRGEATQVRKDGIRIPVEISSLTLRDANGRTEGYISVNRDITERKQAEDELRRARESLIAMNLELETALAREKQLAHTDPLTGINNRRRLYELVEHEIKIAARYWQPLSVMMFDIDHFKKVNDTFGHEVGDHILQRVTQVACGELRSADVIGRYGGEEFVVVLPMTKAKQAYPLAERIRLAIAALCVPTENGDVSVTLSIGIVEMRHGPKNDSAEDMIRRADKAMYAAKQSGRNLTLIGDA